MRITIEEHWTTTGIDRALRTGEHDASVVLNDRGEIPARLLDIGDGRIAAMDAARINVQVLSIAPPGTSGLAAAEAVALARDANEQVSAAVARHPTRLRALTTVPFADPAAAVAELERTAGDPAHVGVMAYGRDGDRPLDHPAFADVLAAAARLDRPMLVHPQIPPDAVRQASFSGLGPTLDLSLATFGWGWHIEAGLAVLRLIVSGVFDRHPGLQVVLGHWGEMLLFALDRVGGLANVTTLERPVADYFATNVHITSSGMLVPRLLHHALDFTSIDRLLLSGDYPFHPLHASAIDDFLGVLPDEADRAKLAHGNAEALFGI